MFLTTSFMMAEDWGKNLKRVNIRKDKFLYIHKIKYYLEIEINKPLL